MSVSSREVLNSIKHIFKLLIKIKMVKFEEVQKEMSNVTTNTLNVFGKRLSVTSIKMSNWFIVTETSKPINDDDYDVGLWEQVNLKKIEDKVRMLLWYSKY